MKDKVKIFLSLALTLMLLAGYVGAALAFDSGGTPEATGPDTITWTGQGTQNGRLEDVKCSSDYTPYLHWILTTDGGSADSATLYLGGTGSGTYSGSNTGGAFHFETPYF
ncbi:hypothetical protein SE15_00935 [Thermanaerothrix daxensis]|uniref:Uncharacterized protein n=1 Tax=Thermanaerothrix daxensis TaxID=869279 RepID=A0A0P6YFT9_9CHLR|nr:hypothetical protein [Thermanaerothrix daxensis]KPL83841.1 hypothetical protein SE15_00935 [Thermanaerothrix daxensis]